MAYIQLHGKQFPIPDGGLTLGCHDGAGLRLSGDDASARAVIVRAEDGTALIRRDAADAVILVNGVQLGGEASPLLHGDKIEMAGEEMRYGDAAQGGSTQFVSSAQVAELAARAKPAAPAKPTLPRGGRLVSLTDGREYEVFDDGITIGREVGNDVVIPSGDVSRKHAEIIPMPGGYQLIDHSTNGLFVNGVRIEQKQVLGRGDVIKLGPEEFRFYADAAKQAPLPPPPGAPAKPAAAPPQVAAPVPAPAPVSTPAPATPPTPVAKPASRAPLATLEIINEGPLKGTRFEIHSALTNVGRGAHNDIVLSDESVSDSHAKIQQRDGAWWVVDQGSTNGTYVGGRRVQGEQRIEGAPDLRFGGMKLTFRPAASAAGAAGGTRAIAAVALDHLPKAAASAPETAPVKKGCAAMIAFLIALSAAGASLLALLLTTGR